LKGVRFETYGGQQMMALSLPDSALANSGQASRKLYFAEHVGVRELVFVPTGQLTASENMRHLNRVAADSIAQMLRLPELPPKCNTVQIRSAGVG
jgi:hypothetical protein